MEPLFTNQCMYTKQNLFLVNKVTSSRILSEIMFFSIGLIIFVLGILAWDFSICLFGIFLCFFFLVFHKLIVRASSSQRYQQLLQLYHCEPVSKVKFYEDHLIHTMQDNSQVKVGYEQIGKVYQTKHLFFLMLSTRVGFLLDQEQFDGITADEFIGFIRTRAVGEGQRDLKRRNRKSAFISACVFLIILVVSFFVVFISNSMNHIIPKVFHYDNYSIKMTMAFEGYEGEWSNKDVTVYCFKETMEELSENNEDYDNATQYLKALNEIDEIESDVVTGSDNVAWTEFTSSSDGVKYYNYDYVRKVNGEFWFSEFYCLEKDAKHYAPLFKKWAKTIKIESP